MDEPREFRRSGPGPENLGGPPLASDLLTEDLSAAAPNLSPPGPREARSWAGGGPESAQRADDSLGFGAKPQGRPPGARKTRAARSQSASGSQAGSPGSSNTRALTPAVSKTAPKTAAKTLLLLSCRVDALTVAYRGKLTPLAYRRLTLTHEEAQERRVEIPTQFAGFDFALQPDGAKSFPIRLLNSDLTVLLGDGIEGFRVQIKASAVFLAITALEDVLSIFEKIAKAGLSGTIEEARVWRADLCADATNLCFSPADSDHFVGCARKRVQCETREMTAGGLQKFTGFLIARGNPLSMRLYDKTEELRSQNRPDTTKTRTEHTKWSEAGWDGMAHVWRLEFELKSKALETLSARDPWKLCQELDALWAYLVGVPGSKKGWLRLTTRDNVRRERCSVDARWELFRSALFEHRKAPSTRSAGNSRGSPILQTMGNVLSTLGSWRAISELERSPKDTVRADLDQIGRAICSDPILLKRYGELRAGKVAALAEVRAPRDQP